MDEERTSDPSDNLPQEPAMDASRLDRGIEDHELEAHELEEREIEERLAGRIAQCRHTLEHIQSRLTHCWSQLNKMQEAFKHDPLT